MGVVGMLIVCERCIMGLLGVEESERREAESGSTSDSERCRESFLLRENALLKEVRS